MMRVVVLLALVCLLIGCESKDELKTKSEADYAVYTVDACRHAEANVNMVENMRSAMSKPHKDESDRSFAEIVCREAAKAAKADVRNRIKILVSN